MCRRERKVGREKVRATERDRERVKGNGRDGGRGWECEKKEEKRRTVSMFVDSRDGFLTTQKMYSSFHGHGFMKKF